MVFRASFPFHASATVDFPASVFRATAAASTALPPGARVVRGGLPEGPRVPRCVPHGPPDLRRESKGPLLSSVGKLTFSALTNASKGPLLPPPANGEARARTSRERKIACGGHHLACG
ncbi:hypothetical protein GCM10023192_61640 [Amycolatopsis samaneae]